MSQNCLHCGRAYEPHPKAQKKGWYCGKLCRTKDNQQWDRETAWYLMELVRLLWAQRGEDFSYQPRAVPTTIKAWREQYKQLGAWIRGLRQ